MTLREELEAEVRALHRAITGWFRGELPDLDTAFERHLAARIDPNLVNIQPAGRVLTAADLLDPMRRSHGANPDFSIRIENVRLIHQGAGPDGPHVVLYEEHQTGARNSPPSNVRISTALIRREGPSGFVWLHIHETWLPISSIPNA